MSAFQRAYQVGKANKDLVASNPSNRFIEFRTSDAFGGLGDPDEGRGFGWEIEFDLEPRVDRVAALSHVGRRLYRLGLTPVPDQERYHRGLWRSTDPIGALVRYQHQEGWRYEQDSTVAGEIVSPVCRDTPETWEKLEAVCSVLAEVGATATEKVSCHINVGSSDFGTHDLAAYNRLLATYFAHEDDIYRQFTDPVRGTHRLASNNSYARPNDTRPIDQPSDLARHPHGYALNLAATSGGRIEFRVADGSLRPEVIQMQTHVALAMTAAAKRRAGESSLHQEQERLSAHMNANPGRRRLRGDEWAAATLGYRRFLDEIFEHDADAKARATGIWAANRWIRH